MPFPPSFDHSWDLTQPPDTQLLNQGALDIRNLKDDTMQRLSLLSGTLANRPTPETVNATWGGAGFGLLYFSTDNGKIYQWNGSAWVDVTSNFFSAPAATPVIVVSLAALLNQTADVASTLLYAVPSSGAGRYRFTSCAVETQVATTSSTLPACFLNWTDLDTGLFVNSTTVLTNLNTGNPSGNSPVTTVVNVFEIIAKASTNINFGTNGYASVGGTPMKFSLRATLEFLSA